MAANGNGYDDRPPVDYVRAERGSSVILNVDKGAANAIVNRVLSALWWSSFWSAAALIGLVGAMVFMYITINTVNVLQYDLFDLRAKTGHAHENTPAPQQQSEEQP